MFKNVASQKVEVFCFDYSTGAPKTGDAANLTLYVSKDGGTVTALTDTSATELSSTNAPGWYSFDVSQTESNADVLLFSGKSSTANATIVGQRILTRPPLFTTLSIDSTGSAKIQTGLKRNTALSKFKFQMVDSTSAPLTGSTVSVSRCIDSATTFTSVGTATELSAGWYHIDLASGDMNGTVIALRMTGSGGSGTPADQGITLITEP